jgi:hypothetical protein
MADTAFTARFRIVDNTKKETDRHPDKKMPVDFTVEQAMNAADWLFAAAKQAQEQGTTVRVYRGKDDFAEEPGFTLWGSIWGDSGSFAPLKIDSGDAF